MASLSKVYEAINTIITTSESLGYTIKANAWTGILKEVREHVAAGTPASYKLLTP